MTDLEARPRSGKRQRLVEAAGDLFHRRGVDSTTLADIAAAAEVPLGNVYYYFKAKDDIVRAVVDAHADQLRTVLRTFDRLRSPQARLVAFTRRIAEDGPMVASYGCPHGTLCSELGKRGDDLRETAATLMHIRVEWAREQFQLMGRKDALDLAHTLIATIQGASELANAYRDPAVLTSQTQHLQRWLRSLSGT